LASFENRTLHKIKQILHKIKQNTIGKKYRYIGIFFPVSVFVFFQIPQQPTPRPKKFKDFQRFFLPIVKDFSKTFESNQVSKNCDV
jgi:hypothetical protein